MQTMKMRLAVLALTLMAATPSIARADVTAFLGRNSAGEDRSVTRGFSAGVSLLVVGFEFEFANSTEDLTTGSPALRTTSARLRPDLRRRDLQLYATTGAGFIARAWKRSGDGLLLNNGGGVKITSPVPSACADYRVFTLRGNRTQNVQRSTRA